MNLAALSRRFVPSAWPEHFGQARLGRQLGLVALPFALQQVVRLVTNVVLAHLLAPQMFGLMLLVNTLRTGMELLSDVGIGQSVVRSPQGDDRAFLNTAWTLQLLRGVILFSGALIAAVPLGRLYDHPDITSVLLAISPVFLLTGLQSPGLFLMQRHLRLRARAVYDVCCTVFQCAFTVALAAMMPTVWALVWGLVVSTAFSTVMSYLAGDRARPRLQWDKRALGELLSFGKWILLSTVLYFAATSTDKVYFVAVLPMALAGVYAIARTFSDLFDQISQRAGAMIIFPRLAQLGPARGREADRLRAKRLQLLGALAVALGGFIAVSDQMILILYDHRYQTAAFMLPLLLIAVWFRLLGSFADSMLMGCSRPAPGAIANGVKFAALLIGLPAAMVRGNLQAALMVMIGAEALRWLILTPILERERLASVASDLALTVLLAISIALGKGVLGMAGLVPTIAQWWALGAVLRG